MDQGSPTPEQMLRRLLDAVHRDTGATTAEYGLYQSVELALDRVKLTHGIFSDIQSALEDITFWTSIEQASTLDIQRQIDADTQDERGAQETA